MLTPISVCLFFLLNKTEYLVVIFWFLKIVFFPFFLKFLSVLRPPAPPPPRLSFLLCGDGEPGGLVTQPSTC